MKEIKNVFYQNYFVRVHFKGKKKNLVGIKIIKDISKLYLIKS